jgi:hypothetical protein
MAGKSDGDVEKKVKHLEFIQNVVNRMANTSFLLKGWSITIVAALFAWSVKEGAKEVLWLGVALTFVFWFLDSYFLWHERMFRALYDHVRTLPDDQIDFSMNQMQFSGVRNWYTTPFSMTLWPFYGIACVAQFMFIRALN